MGLSLKNVEARAEVSKVEAGECRKCAFSWKCSRIFTGGISMSSSMSLQEAYVFVEMLMFAGNICCGQRACTIRVYEVCIIACLHGRPKIKRGTQVLSHVL